MKKKTDVDSLLRAALELTSADELEAYLDDSCGADHALRRQLKTLLRAHHQSDRPVGQQGVDKGGMGFPELEVPDGPDEHKSVLGALEKTLKHVPRVALRDALEEEDDPIVRPTSLEITRNADDRYQLQGEIARGGMGLIIRGRDTDLGRDLAFKLLLDSHRDEPEVIERFIEEAQIGGQLQHPGIVPVYELGQFGDGRPYFTMKLVKGKTLSALLSGRENPQEDRAKFLGIFEQICQTMAYAHSRGVIHRDLKPSNIMVGAFGEVQVMDWGLAKVLPEGGVIDERNAAEQQQQQSIIQTRRSAGSDSADGFGSQTSMGSILGTPAYMPPEQAEGEVHRLDERADVFGLGAILCEILAGKPPYVSPRRADLFRQARQGSLDDCFARLGACGADEPLLEIVRGCLAFEPAGRWRNAGILAERLAAYLQSVEHRLRQAEVGKAEEAARAEEAQRTAAAAEARSRAERRSRRLQVGLSTAVILFTTVGILVTAMFLREQRRQTTVVTNALDAKSDYLYVAHMQMAEQAWQNGSIRRVRELLDQHGLQEGRADRRTFEWFFFDRLCKRLELTPWMNYGDIVTTLFVSPNGQYVVVAGNDNNLQVFDLRSYQRVATLSGHQRKVISLQVASDGRTVVSCDDIGFRVWRRNGDDFESLVQGFTSDPFQTRVSHDARFLLSPAEDTVQIWDLAANETAKRTFAVRSEIADLDWFNRGHQFTVLYANGTVELRQADNQKSVIELLSLEGGAKSLALSQDDRHLALASDDSIETYRLSDTMETSRLHDLGRPDGKFAYLMPLGSSFAAVTSENISIWDFQSGRLGGRIPNRTTTATSKIIAAPEGELIATFGADSLVSLWDGKTGQRRATIRGHSNVVYGAAFDSSGRVLTGGRDGTIRVTNTTEDKVPLKLHGHRGRIWSVAFSPRGDLLASAGEDSDVILWDPETGRQLHCLSDHTESVQYACFSPGQHILASASRDDSIKLWNLEDYQLVGECLGHTGDVNSLEFSADGKRFISGGDDGSVIVWDVDSRKPVARHDSDGRIWAVAYSAEGSLAFGGTDNQVHTWSQAEGGFPEQLYEFDSNVTSLRFSPDSKTLACTTADGTITLLDFHNRVSKWRPTAHSSDAMFTDFSPDGRTLISAGSDGKIQFWYLGVHEPTIQFDAAGAHIHSVSFSPDGSRIASGSWDQTVRIWSLK